MNSSNAGTYIAIGIISLLLGSAIGWYARPMQNAPSDTNGISQSQEDLRVAMRQLWADHIIWTRAYIVDTAAGLNDAAQADAARLMKNQEDLGNAIKPYYGNDAGDKLTGLLKTHINGAVEVLAAAKANDQARLDKAKADWYANGDEIATFISKANPNAWPEADLKSMMKNHLDTTLTEAVDILNKKYDTYGHDFDIVKDHIYQMSDALTDGIVKQFPEKF